MDGKPLTYTAELDGSMLGRTIANPPFLPDREWRTARRDPRVTRSQFIQDDLKM